MKLLVDFFQQGGVVMVLIAAVSLIAWYQAFGSWRRANDLLNELRWAQEFLAGWCRGEKVSALESAQKRKTPLAVLIPARLAGDSLPTDKKTIRNIAAAQLQYLKDSLAFLEAMIGILPLLGLLGTVLGMLITFKVIQGYGSGEPTLLAGGIRQALLTTQAGLWAALPVLFFHQLISLRTRRAAGKLELILHEIETMLAQGKTGPQTDWRN